MLDALEMLYPPGADMLCVAQNFPMIGQPAELKEQFDRDGGKLYTFPIKDELLGFINKLYPHSLHDLMLLVLDHPIKSSINDISSESIAMLGQIAYRFVEFVSDPAVMADFGLENGRFHCCYNYDRDTLDRESGMSDKRFHLHLNYWTATELSHLHAEPLKAIDPSTSRRTYLDPCAFLGAEIAYQLLKDQLPIGTIIEPNLDYDQAHGLPIGLKIAFDDWSCLQDPALGNLLQLIHTRLIACYEDLCLAFTGTTEPAAAWERHALLPTATILERIEALTYLSSSTKQNLAILAQRLRTISPRLMQYLRIHRKYRTRHLAMNGLNYALGFYTQQLNRPDQPLSKQGPIYLVLQTKLFSEIGGAGLAYMGTVPMVRIRRGSEAMNAEQLRTRARFQSEFIQQIKPQLTEENLTEYVVGS